MFSFFDSKTKYRIYGDNIIECFRLIELISKNNIQPLSFDVDFDGISSLLALDEEYGVAIELYPGFGKADKRRWASSIIENFQKEKALLDETPDAFLTAICGEEEKILCAIEFCSALQAGNQAWQRSGRAYTVGKTGIPYLYIVDFTKYELDSMTRERKAIRLPNLAVPLSYNAYSKHTGNLVIEAYFRSEEYNPEDPKLKDKGFEKVFSEQDVSNYLFSLMKNLSTAEYEANLFNKNHKMVSLLAPESSASSVVQSDLENLDYDQLVKFIEEYCDFHAKKKIEEKSSDSTELRILNDYLGMYSDGVFSADLPFCMLKKAHVRGFMDLILKAYETNNIDVESILMRDSVVVVIIKGFKPRGDDNRPDRGIMPLIRMIFGESITVLTILYGPILQSSYSLLKDNQDELAQKNGLWKTILYYSDYLLVDAPVISKANVELSHKKELLKTSRDTLKPVAFKQSLPTLNMSIVSLREDDVDDLILTAYQYHDSNVFSGLCNPPGGDWSGMSVLKNTKEYRWLSLPRVSEQQLKRPDHVIQFLSQNTLLVIESKDYANNLEDNIGPRLSGYVRWLMQFVPSVMKENGQWSLATNSISAREYTFLTAGAFMGEQGDSQAALIRRSNVDLVFNFVPVLKKSKWIVEIAYKPLDSVEQILKETVDAFKALSNVLAVSTKKVNQ